MADNVKALPTPKRAERRPQSHAHISEAYQQSFLSLSQWTVAMVRNALDNHERGDFSGSSRLVQALLRDPQVFSGLQTRANALASRLGLPFCVQPAAVPDKRTLSTATTVAETMLTYWWDCCPTAEIAAFQRDAIMLGVAVGRDELQWLDGDWYPKFKHYRPSGLRFRAFENDYTYTGQDGIEHVVTPGINGWVLHLPNGPDSFLLGAILPLGTMWKLRDFGFRDLGRSSEKHGMPALKVKEPYQATDDVEGSDGATPTNVNVVYNSIRNMGSEAVIRLPQPQNKDDNGFDAEWMELVSTPSDVFLSLIRETRQEIVTVLLGRDPNTSQTIGGDGASLLERVRGEYLSADAEALANTLREQLWMPWVVRSVDALRPRLAGFPVWDVRPPTDLVVRGQALKGLSDALPGLVSMGVNVAPILEAYGLALLPDVKEAKAPAPAPTPAGTDADSEPDAGSSEAEPEPADQE